MKHPIDLDRARRFVEQNGTSLEKMRLRAILDGENPDPSTLQPLMNLQNKDGGFPSRPRPGSVSSVDNTLTSIWQLDELGMFPSPSTDRALEFLISVQQEDGGWDENPALPGFDLAPWVIPGDRATRLYLSSYTAYWLGLGPHVNSTTFARAMDYLTAHQEEDGHMPGFQHNTWLATGAFLLGGSAYQAQAQRSVGFLANRPFSEWEDSQLAWAVDTLSRAGLPSDQPWISAALDQFGQRQSADGSWASEDGPEFCVSATLQVIKLFRRYQLS